MQIKAWTIGGDPDCDILVDEDTVSGQHCRLTRQPDGFYYLEDIGSTNGTFVNGERLTSPRQVSKSDKITLGKKAVLPWPNEAGKAQPSQTAETPPSDAAAGGWPPALTVAVGAALLLLGIGLGGILVKQFWPETAAVDPDPKPNSTEETEAELENPKPRPKEGFKMGQFRASQPIKKIEVTIDVGENGQALDEMLDLHLGLGFPLRLYPVGSDSRELSFAAFPHESSLDPGENTVQAGDSASFEFDVSASEGLDELKTIPTLLKDLTVGDIHSIGFACKGENDWVLAGYKIEINGDLFASNDSVQARPQEIQAQNDLKMQARKAEYDALKTQVKNQQDIVDSGLATQEEKDALQESLADLALITTDMNDVAGRVAGYYPCFQESDPAFKPTKSADPRVESVVVTMVTAQDDNSGSGNLVYLDAGGQKHLLAAPPSSLSNDSKQEQRFKLDGATLKYDPISKEQLKDFAIGMLGSDLPFGQVPDRAKLQSVAVEVDGQVDYNSDDKEVDRKTLGEIRLLPPAHRDGVGTRVENPESARQWYAWKPGKTVVADAGNVGPIEEEPEDKKPDEQIADNKTPPTPPRDPNKPIILVINNSTPRQPNFPAWPPWVSPPWSGGPWSGGSPWSRIPRWWPTWPISILPPPPTQPPVVSNVRIVSPAGLLKHNDRATVNWNVAGNTRRISYYRVRLYPVLPHQRFPHSFDVLASYQGPAFSSARLSAINLANFTGNANQTKYLYLRPQVTAFDIYGNTINGASAFGPIVPVSQLGAFAPQALAIGPHSSQWPLQAGQTWPGFQRCGNGFGPLPSPFTVNTNDRWIRFANAPQSAWALKGTSFTPSCPLKFAPFSPNMGTRSSNISNALRSEVQTLTLVGTPAAGKSFRVRYGTAAANPTTVAIAYNAAMTDNNIQAALNAALGSPPTPNNYVTVTGPTGPGTGGPGAYTIRFQNGLANANLEKLNAVNIAGGMAASVANSVHGSGCEVQKLTVAGPAASSFRLRYDDVTSGIQNLAGGAAIAGPYGGLTAVQLQNHLNAIPVTPPATQSPAGNVTVVGNNGGPFTVVFNNALAGTNVPALLAETTSGCTVTVDTVSNGGRHILVRYDLAGVNLTGNCHVVAHLDFTDAGFAAGNFADIIARVMVATPTPTTLPPSAWVNPNGIVCIETNRFRYTHSPGNPMQLIDLPIRVGANGAAYTAALNAAQANCQLAGTAGPKLRLTEPVLSSTPAWAGTPAIIPNAHVIVMFEIQQGGAGSGGVGIFGARLVPGP